MSANTWAILACLVLAWYFVGVFLLVRWNSAIHRAAQRRQQARLALIAAATLPACIVELVLYLVDRRGR